MNLLPYNKFCITTHLTPAEVQEHLLREVELKSSFSFKNIFAKPTGRYFKGFVVNGVFELTRVIDYRNSFLPVIKGRTETALNGSIVYVSMGLHPFVAIFMCLWLGGVGIMCVKVLVTSIATFTFEPLNLIIFGMFAFGYAMVMGGYTYERNKAKKQLLELLTGEVDDTIVFKNNLKDEANL